MAADNVSLIELPKVNLEGVLRKLPLQSLVVCCSVSKSLLNLIKNDSDFARMHLANSEPQLMIQSLSQSYSNLHLINLDTDTASRVEVKPNFNTPLDGFGITHSCNGLLLLERRIRYNNIHQCMIYNPVTSEYTLLPETVARYKSLKSGFFYCPETNRFEVLCAFYRNRIRTNSDVSSHSSMDLDESLNSDYDSDSAMEPEFVSYSENSDYDTDLEYPIEPYSSSDSDSDTDYEYFASDAIGKIYVKGSDSWKSLGKLPFSPLAIYHPCHLDKAVHWICMDESVLNLILFFNFETHKFGSIPGPIDVMSISEDVRTDVALVVVGDCLLIIDRVTTQSIFTVWVMKEYGLWSRDFVMDATNWGTVDTFHCLTPSTVRNSGEVVMVNDYGYILFYDLLTKKGRVVNYPPLKLHWRAVMHTPSLMPLRDVVSGTNLEVVNVTPRLARRRVTQNNYLELSTTFSEEAAETAS